ncbi:WD40-repeat-containing domain protein, partial [Mycena belliarum]
MHISHHNHFIHLNTQIRWSPDMRRIVSGSLDCTVRVWSTRDHGSGHATVLKGHDQGVYTVAFSPNGRNIASGGLDGKICIWSSGDNQLLQQFSSYKGVIQSVLFCDDNTLVSGSRYGDVFVWDISGSASKGKGPQWAHGRGVHAVAISHNSRLFVSTSEDSTIALWSAVTGDIAWVAKDPHGVGVTFAAFSADDTMVATASEDDHVWFWDTVTGTLIGPALEFSEIHCLAFSHAGCRLAICLDSDLTIEIWNAST